MFYISCRRISCTLFLFGLLAASLWAPLSAQADSSSPFPGRTWRLSPPGVGYGYLWWVGQKGWHFGQKFPGSVFSARGNFGQYLIVDPLRDLVIVHGFTPGWRPCCCRPGRLAVSSTDC